MSWLAEQKDQPGYPDQDALNAVVGDCWYRLDRSWNHFFFEDETFTTEGYEGAKIAHLAGPKPWDYSEHPGAAVYNRFLTRLRGRLDAVGGQTVEDRFREAAFSLGDQDGSMIRAGAGGLASRLRFLEIEESTYSHIKRRYTEQYPPAVLGRLFIACSVGDPNARLLILDSDMIVNGSLRPLSDLDLGAEFFAAVHDLRRKDDPKSFFYVMSFTEFDTYKYHDIARRCLDWLVENPHAALPDQEALNCIIGDSWYRLDGTWNRYLVDDRPITLEDYEGARIAHFAHRKPWDWAGHPGAPVYNRYLARLRLKLDAGAQGGRFAASSMQSDYADGDFIASCYEVFLGRELESATVVRERAGWPLVDALKSVVNSA